MFDEEVNGRRDHNSDPAHTPGDGWGEEGGASHLGPATHTEADQAFKRDGESDEKFEAEPDA